MVPRPVIDASQGARIGIVAYGSSDPAVMEARHILKTEKGVDTSYLRMRSLPLNGEVEDFLASHEVIYVVDQNRDGQMATILRGELPETAINIRSVRHYNGLPIDALTIVEQILEQESH